MFCAKESTRLKESFKKNEQVQVGSFIAAPSIKTDMDAGVEDGRREVFGGF